ncbi:phosphatase PAP2 family protein [Streptomyces sp. SD31]|uniref:phosphatase PAP2 family protein n=1 Tax=Streptomyces sp. SD31 TaxID=3452208 RepID=UPI003F8B33FF
MLFVTTWGRARRDTTRAFAIAALAPLATAMAYLYSHHATITGAAAVTPALPLGLGLVMALSRVFVGVHHPDDAAAGLALAALVRGVRTGVRTVADRVGAVRTALSPLNCTAFSRGAD